MAEIFDFIKTQLRVYKALVIFTHSDQSSPNLSTCEDICFPHPFSGSDSFLGSSEDILLRLTVMLKHQIHLQLQLQLCRRHFGVLFGAVHNLTHCDKKTSSSEDKQPQSIMLPPPCFIVGMMFFYWNLLLLWPRKSIWVLSDGSGSSGCVQESDIPAPFSAC